VIECSVSQSREEWVEAKDLAISSGHPPLLDTVEDDPQNEIS
jgi:hypothetical protein